MAILDQRYNFGAYAANGDDDGNGSNGGDPKDPHNDEDEDDSDIETKLEKG